MPSTAEQIEVRRREAARMAIAGMPRQTICQHLGISHETLRLDLKVALSTYYGPAQEEVDLWRTTILEQASMLTAKHLPKAMSPDDPKSYESFHVVERCWARASRILGLESITVNQGTTTEADDVARMQAALDALKASATLARELAGGNGGAAKDAAAN